MMIGYETLIKSNVVANPGRETRVEAQGIEFFLQRKMSGNFQGTLSYSYSQSRAFDLCFGEYYDWDYDYRHVFTAISSFRWRYLGGRPYTEQTYQRKWHTWITEENQKMNTRRHSVYHRLDIRLDRRFMFGGWNMVTYLDIQNVYNRDNIWGVQYKENGETEDVLQFKLFPIGGLAIEF